MKCSNTLRRRLLILAAAIGTLGAASMALASDWSRPIHVVNPVKLPATLPAEQIALGQGYKPSMAMLSSGELVLCSFTATGSHEWTKLWRSSDYGRTWSDSVRVERVPGQDLIGREHFLTSINDGTTNGVLLSTSTILGSDPSCPPGYESHPPAYINRSTDGGRSWTQTQIGPSGFSTSDPYTRIARNVVEMPGGRLVFGVGAWGYSGRENYLWTSTNKGASWQQSAQAAFGTYTNYKGQTRSYYSEENVFDEAYFYKNKENNLVMFDRLYSTSPLYPMDANPPPGGSDDLDRTLMATSTNGGLTWGNFQDFGGYGQMYPRAIRLADDRVLMTLTQQSGDAQLGLRALLSYDDGQTWDFGSDQIILDANTPLGWAQGGGFGNTIQLPDGSLISCYSYHSEEYGVGNYRTEVVRWALHAAEPSTLWLLAVGTVCFLANVWRKRKTCIAATVRWPVVALFLWCSILTATAGQAAVIPRLSHGESLTISALGASLTAPESSTWVARTATWLNGMYPGKVTVDNEAVGGMSSQTAMSTQLNAAINHHPGVVFLDFGAIDAYPPFGISVQQSRTNLQGMINQINASAAYNHEVVDIIIMTMNNLKDRDATPYYQAHREVAVANNLLLIDNYPNWLNLYNSQPNHATWNSYVPDGLHPNDPGTQQVIMPEVQRALLAQSPEPSSWIMLVTGLLGVWAYAWKKRR